MNEPITLFINGLAITTLVIMLIVGIFVPLIIKAEETQKK